MNEIKRISLKIFSKPDCWSYLKIISAIASTRISRGFRFKGTGFQIWYLSSMSICMCAAVAPVKEEIAYQNKKAAQYVV